MPVNFDICDQVSDDLDKAPKFQNTYRLDTEKPFKIDPVDKIVKSVMLNRLEDASYDVKECPKLCSQVASEIRKRILKLDFKRYKIVVAVTIIEKASQSLETTMGFVWDVDRDNYSTYTFETQTFFAYCIVIGTYYE
ncbi:dynein light chain Tctex-type 5-like isoform X2 [Venturia canescens]|uniref:dynein light chain Tctex-type 5-like isoform X2 n=1 Tax=Venturia canescens TaxID=32260 RepID=UPI001C9D3942|nr:dynein light chain Tctex-type 5-like isoform X2 [Venturia canescens]